MKWISIKSQHSSATTALKLFRNCCLEAEENAQRAFAALPEDSSALCPCAQHLYWAAHSTMILAPGDPIPSLGLQDSNTHTNTHIIKKKKKVVILECCPKLKRL